MQTMKKPQTEPQILAQGEQSHVKTINPARTSRDVGMRYAPASGVLVVWFVWVVWVVYICDDFLEMSGLWKLLSIAVKLCCGPGALVLTMSAGLSENCAVTDSNVKSSCWSWQAANRSTHLFSALNVAGLLLWTPQLQIWAKVWRASITRPDSLAGC